MLSHFSCVQLFVTLWTVARQAPLFMGFSRQEYCNGLPWLPPGESSQPRNRTCISDVSCIGKQIIYHCTTMLQQSNLAVEWETDWKVTDEEAQWGAVSVDQARDKRISWGQCFSDLSGHQNPLEGLLKPSLLAPPPVSDSVGLEWAQKLTFLTSAGVADVSGLRTTLWGLLAKDRTTNTFSYMDTSLPPPILSPPK